MRRTLHAVPNATEWTLWCRSARPLQRTTLQAAAVRSARAPGERRSKASTCAITVTGPSGVSICALPDDAVVCAAGARAKPGTCPAGVPRGSARSAYGLARENAARLPRRCSIQEPPTGGSAPSLAGSRPAASRRAAASAPPFRLPVLERSGHDFAVGCLRRGAVALPPRSQGIDYRTRHYAASTVRSDGARERWGRRRSQGSLRRLLAIGFAAKESSDVDNPHDHSVAEAQASRSSPPMTNAIVRTGVARDALAAESRADVLGSGLDPCVGRLGRPQSRDWREGANTNVEGGWM